MRHIIIQNMDKNKIITILCLTFLVFIFGKMFTRHGNILISIYRMPMDIKMKEEISELRKYHSWLERQENLKKQIRSTCQNLGNYF